MVVVINVPGVNVPGDVTVKSVPDVPVSVSVRAFPSLVSTPPVEPPLIVIVVIEGDASRVIVSPSTIVTESVA
jgi:hypothetical protein